MSESLPVRRIAVGVTGASGAIYAVRTIAALLDIGCHLDVVFSEYGRRLLMDELGPEAKVDRLPELLAARYGERAAGAACHRCAHRVLGSRERRADGR